MYHNSFNPMSEPAYNTASVDATRAKRFLEKGFILGPGLGTIALTESTEYGTYFILSFTICACKEKAIRLKIESEYFVLESTNKDKKDFLSVRHCEERSNLCSKRAILLMMRDCHIPRKCGTRNDAPRECYSIK